MIFTTLGLGRFAFFFLRLLKNLFSLIPLKYRFTVLWGNLKKKKSKKKNDSSTFYYSVSGLWGGTSNNCNLTIITNQGPNNYFFLLEANDHKRGAFSIACWIEICSLLQLFVSTAVPVDYEGLLKLLVLFENVKLLESSFILFCFVVLFL